MNLLKSFQSTTGLKPGKGYIYERIYPLPFDNYIILDTQSADPNKTYSFWFRVIELIEPILAKENINIIHFIEDKKYYFNHIYIDSSVHLSHKAYLIKKAKLLCGPSKIYSLIASEYNTKQCYLKYDYYLDNTLAEDDCVIHSNYKRKNFVNPTGAPINNIRPEEIAKKIIKMLLNYEPEFDNTISIGRVYATQSIEIIPDNVFDIKSDAKNDVVIRMDYLFAEDNLDKQLQVLPAFIVTNKPIDKNILIRNRKNIKKIYFKIEKNSQADFVSELAEIGIDCDLITSLSAEDLNKEKIKYLDFKKINKLNVLDLDFLDGLDKSKIYYKANKIVVKSGKTFCSRWNARVSLNHPSVREAQCALPPYFDDEFKEEADYFYFLTKEKL